MLEFTAYAGLATFHSFNLAPWERGGLLELGVRIKLSGGLDVSSLLAG